jgi:NSS family neurotransmitter:Na+ symporter
MLTYGSYMPGGSIARSALVIAVADTLVALVGGVVIFPAVFSFGTDPAAGVQLAFVTLPRIFEEIPLGFLVGAAFFCLLFLAALTSAVSLLEVPVATLLDLLGWGRKRATALAAGVILLAGLPAALSYSPLRLELFGQLLLDLMDLAFGTVGLIAGGLVLTVSAGWFLPARTLAGELGGGRAARRAFVVLVRLVIPAALAVNLAIRLLGGGS